MINSLTMISIDSNYLLYGILALSLISLLISLFILFYFIPKSIKKATNVDLVLDKLSDSFIKKGRFYSIIESRLSSNVKNNLPSTQVDIHCEKWMSKNTDLIVDRVLHCIELNNRERSQNIESTKPKLEISKEIFIDNVMYASSANPDSNTFFKVTSRPDEDTIYQLNLSGDTATFHVFEGAYKKVLVAPDFLECAADISGYGNQKVVNIKVGNCEMQSNGLWRIVSKVQLKFE